MPLKRTPPASPLTATTTAQLLPVTCDNNATMGNQGSTVADPALNVAGRKKRTIKQNEKGIDTLSMNIFTTFSKEQEKRFEDLISKINNIIEQNCELKSSVEMMSEKHDAFLKRITHLESERKEDRKRITHLENTIESLERKNRACSVEIRNIPKINGETKEMLGDLVTKVGHTVNVNIEGANIRDVFRVSSKDNSNPVIVELNTVVLKNQLIKGVKEYNRNKKNCDKLNITHINPKQPPKPLYVAESLTHKTQRLYSSARAFQRTHGYSFCWTSHGIVYIRKQANDPQIRIHTEADLEKLKAA